MKSPVVAHCAGSGMVYHLPDVAIVIIATTTLRINAISRNVYILAVPMAGKGSSQLGVRPLDHLFFLELGYVLPGEAANLDEHLLGMLPPLRSRQPYRCRGLA